MLKCFAVLAIVVAVLGRVEAASGFVATSKIEAEFYTSAVVSVVSSTGCGDGTVYLGENDPNAHVCYGAVDFGSGVEMVTLRVASWRPFTDTGNLLLHLGDYSSLPFATVPIRTTGQNAYCSFFTLPVFLQTTPTGVQDLCFTFDTPQDQSFVNIDWFTFNNTVNWG